MANEIETLDMSELLEFARMLENIEDQTALVICAAHLVHCRIEELARLEIESRSAATYSYLRNEFKNGAFSRSFQ